MNLPSDDAVRQLALDTRRSFAVSAPAGSGKTGLLTQRVLALLAIADQPENILAITFTKKAAAEMQERIMAALHFAQDHPHPPKDAYNKITWELARAVLQRDQQQQWQLLALPHRLRITTIDSFCRQLSQHTPLSNRLGNTPTMLENTEAEHAYRLAARETLAFLEKNHPVQSDLIRLARHFNNQLLTVETLFVNLLRRRDQWLGHLISTRDKRQWLEATLEAVITEHLEDATHALLPIAGELLLLADYASKTLNAAGEESPICACLGMVELPPAEHSALAQWLGLVELITTKDGKIRATIDKRWGFPAPDKSTTKEEQAFAKAQKQRMLALLAELATRKGLSASVHTLRTLPSANYNESQWQLLDSLTRVLILLVAQCRLVFQHLGKTDFIEITLAALAALTEYDANGDEQPTDLALTLDYRLQHILVDEFQDTSSPQLQLLKSLTAGWQSGDGRTLFVVGDAMQSCYGFRDANVGIFLDIREQGLGNIELTALDLSVNFRSQKGLVDWCNQVFSEVFPANNGINQGAVRYQPAIAFNPPLETTSVTSHLFVSETKTTQRRDEAQQIVTVIHSTRQLRPEASIAILVRKRQQVGAITQALTQAGLHYRASDIDRLNSNMLILDLLSLTRALLYPNDRITWLALLRAPWCGLNITDLHTLATTTINQQAVSIPCLLLQHAQQVPLSAEGRAVLQRFTDAISHSCAQQGRRKLREWVEACWLQLGGHALLINNDEHYALDAYWSVLEKYQQGAGLADWDSFTAAVNQLYITLPVTPADSGGAPDIEIMTIHKSKGLEFDTVIMPGLDLSTARDKQALLSWMEWLDREQEAHLLISPVHATGDDRDPIHDYIRQQQQQRQALEADRLFYVGCTRAISQLHLLAYVIGPDHKDPNALKPPSENSALHSIWDHIVSTALYYLVSAIDDPETTLQHPNMIVRLSHLWQRPPYPTNDLLADYRLLTSNENIDDNRARPDQLQQRHKRYFGTLLHSAIQQITESGYRHWNQQHLEQQGQLWRQQLHAMGVPSALAQAQSIKIIQAMANMLASKTGVWLLDNQHKCSACELSFWSGQQEYIIDRTFIDTATNTRWIIDYKSSELDEQQSLADFLAQETQAYRQQLTHYATLFANESLTLRTALYFPLLDKLHEIT
jgi:ATP-dependent exoDNAse (exonuclease V) beta subunit